MKNLFIILFALIIGDSFAQKNIYSDLIIHNKTFAKDSLIAEKTMKIGDSLLLSPLDTVYKESLNERDFATSTKWITTGSFSISGGTTTFSGTSGTLKQKENKLALTGLGGNKYRFIYTVSNMTGVGCTAFINTDFASSNTNLVLVNAIDTLNFTSGSDPTDFKIECTCTSGGFDLDDFSLKVNSDSIVFVKNDLYAGGIFAEGSSAFGGDVQILGNLKGGSPLTISTPIGDIKIDGDIHLIKDAENWTIGIDTSDIDQFKISNDDTLGVNDRLVIDTLGNVGIGIATPSNKLHVVTAGNPAKFESTSGNGRIEIDAPDTKNAGMQLFENGVLRWGIFNQGTDDALKFQNKDFATRMIVEQGGNIGVGTIIPDELIHSAKAIDGIFTGLLIENSQTNTASSTNEISEIRFGFGGNNDAVRFSVFKQEDFTSTANESAGLSYFARLDGTTSESMRFFSDGTLRLLRVGSLTTGVQLQFQGVPGGSDPFGPGILYLDASSTLRNVLMFPGSDKVVLSNRAPNGTVEIRANTSTAGSGGEITVATFQDDTISLLISGGRVGIANGVGNTPKYRLDVGDNSYFAINGNFAHIMQHNSAASTFWSIAPRNGGDLDIAVTTTDPRPTSGTIATSGNAISIKTNKDVEFLGSVGIGTATPNAESLLELESTTKALRLTRVTTTQRIAMTGVSGLIVYDSTLEFIFYHTGSAWIQL